MAYHIPYHIPYIAKFTIPYTIYCQPYAHCITLHGSLQISRHTLPVTPKIASARQGAGVGTAFRSASVVGELSGVKRIFFATKKLWNPPPEIQHGT